MYMYIKILSKLAVTIILQLSSKGGVKYYHQGGKNGNCPVIHIYNQNKIHIFKGFQYHRILFNYRRTCQ